ncbi:MAG: tRNA (adenosine(37)-N6)-threonylcarbamoyltransferase complex dimerization subunit type 1 TsaB [Bacteroidetes bacterium]|nr:tRNA (adenosine(37)-N6)-threonylcarbamoyltransferase complex dimerization subunit type 1 TsaB [Bacteroidota bacterium]MCH8233605.1 tRNA (adenosine(37)-N6)-threonylcarbamoyltransferase complex dimerization subunit type 1 TsaB [Bacteroidota bacterium]
MNTTLLSLETSTDVCSLALHQDGRLVADFSLHIQQAHSRSLAALVDLAFDHAKVDKRNLDAVAVSKGPGSYTGLRIGTSLAKGLCFALDIPLIAVNTLESMAFTVNCFNHHNAILCPMIDARRMEVYCLLANSNLEIIEDTHAKIIDNDSFSSVLKRDKVWFFGSGTEKCETLLGHQNNAVFIRDFHITAQSIGMIAFKKFENKDFEDLAYFEPFYLKDFIAGKPKSLL